MEGFYLFILPIFGSGPNRLGLDLKLIDEHFRDLISIL
jgi:hypothetical protein